MKIKQTDITALIPYSSNSRDWEHARRFQDKFMAGGGCWEWKADIVNRYPSFSIGGKNYKAHRVAYSLYVGPIPEGMHVLHRCDNTKCVNPAHLFVGTHKDNMADRAAKGRAADTGGIKNGRAKINNMQARIIFRLARSGSMSQEAIGAMFGLHHCSVSRIKRGEQWANV